jgi:hypothetical protein
MQADLIELIEDFRAELEAELPAQLHTTSGESGSDWRLVADQRRTNGHPATWTGLPFTAPFMRYLGHSDQYGAEFIAAAAMDEIRDYCRSHHDPSHFDAEPTTSLCRRLAVAVVEMRQPLSFIAAQEGIDRFLVHQHLLDVLRHAEKWRLNRRETIADRDTQAQAALDNPIAETLRRQHNEPYERRVWDRMRLRHKDWRGEPLLPEWEVERERRFAQHRKLGCSECLQEAA